MSDAAPIDRPPARAPASLAARLLPLLLPVLFMAAAIAWFLAADPLRSFDNGAPPVENITFERTILDDQGLRLLVRAGGSEPMRIAQVQVDDAYWQFTQEPPGPLARGSTAWLRLPFPWVLGEAHAVTVVTNTGTTFSHDIAVAVPTPQASGSALLAQAMLGIAVGILPVALGLTFYPALRGLGRNGIAFLLALTVGMLTYLLLDSLEEAFELAAQSAAAFQGPTMVLLGATASFLLLMAIGRRKGSPEGLALAFFIALGIGLHNLGEGLAIGAAFASGLAGLGTFLVLGFAFHNITEGIGIAAPILKIRTPLWTFAALTLLAGGPAVVGMWLGSLAYSPHWSALALAVGAGAILQVVVEVSLYLMRTSGIGLRALTAPSAMTGLAAGLAFMYFTAMAVKI